MATANSLHSCTTHQKSALRTMQNCSFTNSNVKENPPVLVRVQGLCAPASPWLSLFHLLQQSSPLRLKHKQETSSHHPTSNHGMVHISFSAIGAIQAVLCTFDWNVACVLFVWKLSFGAPRHCPLPECSTQLCWIFSSEDKCKYHGCPLVNYGISLTQSWVGRPTT